MKNIVLIVGFCWELIEIYRQLFGLLAKEDGNEKMA